MHHMPLEVFLMGFTKATGAALVGMLMVFLTAGCSWTGQTRRLKRNRQRSGVPGLRTAPVWLTGGGTRQLVDENRSSDLGNVA